MDWRCDSSGRVPALFKDEALSPNSSATKKKEKKEKY
jgi:hypothetical protein